jgi:hypothetical protein
MHWYLYHNSPSPATLVYLNSVLDNDPFDVQAICIGTCIPQLPITCTLVYLTNVLDNNPFDVQACHADLTRPVPQLPSPAILVNLNNFLD